MTTKRRAAATAESCKLVIIIAFKFKSSKQRCENRKARKYNQLSGSYLLMWQFGGFASTSVNAIDESFTASRIEEFTMIPNLK